MKIYFLFFILVVSACSSVANLKTNNSDVEFEKTNPNDIKVHISDNILTTSHHILGEVIVAADAGTNAKSVVNKLKIQASELGADTIINLRLEFEYGYWHIAIKATGTAIKMN